MKWFVIYEKNGNQIFCQKANTREIACGIAFEQIKALTEIYNKQGIRYKWTDKGNEICIETDSEKHIFSVCPADEHYFPIVFLIFCAIIVIFLIMIIAIFWQELKAYIISYLLALAVFTCFLYCIKY